MPSSLANRPVASLTYFSYECEWKPQLSVKHNYLGPVQTRQGHEGREALINKML